MSPFGESKPPIYLGRARRKSLSARAPIHGSGCVARGNRVNLLERYDYPLEDETGSVQVIVWPKLKAQLRGPLLRSKLMAVKGTWQRDGDVRNLIAGHVEDLTALLGGLATSSRDFH